MAFRTLEDLRVVLRTRLGYAAAGASAGVQQTILDSFLQTAQSVLYAAHDWVKLKKYEDKTLGVNQYLLDYPVTANPDRVKAIAIKDGTLWTPPLKKGIPPEQYTYQDNTRRPSRWEPYTQIEFDAKADKIYTVRIFFIELLPRFTQNADRAEIDDNLVLIFALADAKAHYHQPDAENYAKQREALLLKLKAKSWGQTTFRPDEYSSQDGEVLPKPTVI